MATTARDFSRLTSLGSGALWDPRRAAGLLARLVAGLPLGAAAAGAERLLVGLEPPDDAAVYDLGGGAALVFCADCLEPVVDDAYGYGAIAASHALGDIFAMGGRPVLALNLASFPHDMPAGVAAAILRGASDSVHAAGAAIAGGDTVASAEPVFGLAVLGTVDPAAVIRKGGARPGDRIVLTKPIGTGTITAAARRGTALPEALRAATDSMTAINGAPSEAARAAGVRCGTDVAALGLLGHASELAAASGMRLHLRSEAVPLLIGALHHAGSGDVPAGAARNAAQYAPHIEVGAAVDPLVRQLCFSPEIAGGLLLAVPPHAAPGLVARCAEAGVHAAVVGEALPGRGLRLD